MHPLHTTSARYPIGNFSKPKIIDKEILFRWIASIEAFPANIKKFTRHLSPQELDKRYRADGWTIEQLVHHCADSHMNSYIRFKLALTEDTPEIRPYYEDRWAALSDYKQHQIEDSLVLITVLHKKWVAMLKSLTPAQLQRTFKHPESKQVFSLEENIGIYAWHCEHHLKHIQIALERNQDQS